MIFASTVGLARPFARARAGARGAPPSRMPEVREAQRLKWWDLRGAAPHGAGTMAINLSGCREEGSYP